MHYEYKEKNREGDHICYISNLGKIKQHYPHWSITKSLTIYSSKYSDLGNSGVVYNIHIVNRYYPPNPAVTGEEASKMAAYLLNCLAEVAVSIDYIDAHTWEGVRT